MQRKLAIPLYSCECPRFSWLCLFGHHHLDIQNVLRKIPHFTHDSQCQSENVSRNILEKTKKFVIIFAALELMDK